MHLEKLDQCPHCHKTLNQHEYDMQLCTSCKTGVDFKKFTNEKGECDEK